MRKITSVLSVLAVTWTTCLSSNAVLAATPNDPDQARIDELQHQVDALDQELNQLKSASDPAAQQRGMQRHWSMMQDHMGSLRGMPGMGGRGCTDWMMMDPSMMGSGKMRPGMMGNGRMGGGMMGPTATGCAMMGHGMQPGGTWDMPPHMTSGQYQSQMQGGTTRMRSRMAAIAAEKDPTKRDALLREHYQSMYRDMQTMRGRGWMWTPNAAASLPDRDSQGAKLVATICSQCHSPPSPSLHTPEEWAGVTARMRQHMQAQTGASVRIPSPAELDVLTQYLAGHAADAQPPQ